MQEAKWVTGFARPQRDAAPRWVAAADAGQLVVTVVVIDIATATISTIVDLDPIGAQLPNDVTVDEATGDLCVSDMLRNAIYPVSKDSSAPEVFLEFADLESPNGLLVDGDPLLGDRLAALPQLRRDTVWFVNVP